MVGTTRFVGKALKNGTDRDQKLSFEMRDKVGVSSSLEVSAGVKVGLEGIASGEVWSTYRTSWTTEHEFTEKVEVMVAPHSKGWVTVQEPVKRFTGNITVTFHGTTTILQDVVFETPDPRYQGSLEVHQSALPGGSGDGRAVLVSPEVAAAGGGADRSQGIRPSTTG